MILLKKIISLILIFGSFLNITFLKAETVMQSSQDFKNELVEMGIKIENSDNTFKFLTVAQFKTNQNIKLFLYVYNSTKFQEIISMRLNINQHNNLLIDLKLAVKFDNYFKYETEVDNQYLETENNYDIIYLNSENSNGLKALNVSQSFLFFQDENGENQYLTKKIETVEITDFFAGYTTYNVGGASNPGLSASTAKKQDYHYLAFSTKNKIDYLYEVEIEYYSKKMRKNKSCWLCPTTVSEIENNGKKNQVVNHTQSINLDKYFFRKAFVFDRINKIDQLDNLNEDIKKYDFFVRYVETDRSISSWHLSKTEDYTEITNVVILCLKFEIDGTIYNLSAVSDTIKSPIQTDDPLNVGLSIEDIIYIIVFIAACILSLFLIIICFKLFNAFKYIFKSVFEIIILPFKFIFWILKYLFVSSKKVNS